VLRLANRVQYAEQIAELSQKELAVSAFGRLAEDQREMNAFTDSADMHCRLRKKRLSPKSEKRRIPPPLNPAWRSPTSTSNSMTEKGEKGSAHSLV
jgi:hypothetical protein